MTTERLLAQLQALASIDPSTVLLPGAHVLRNKAYENYVQQTDPDAFEDEFVYEESGDGAHVISSEEFNIGIIEFGTGTFGGAPFMRPAIESERENIIRAVADEVQKQIKEITNNG